MPNAVVPFADPGFGADCVPQLPLGTPEQVLAAWEACLPAGTAVSAVAGVREQFGAATQRAQTRAGGAVAAAGVTGKTSKAAAKGGAVAPPSPDPLPTSVADQYTPAQLARIKAAIQAAASRLRITLNQED